MKWILITGIFEMLWGSLSAGQPISTMAPAAPGHATVEAAQAAHQSLHRRNSIQVPVGVEQHLDLTYKIIGKRHLKLDLYAPEKNSVTPAPGLVFVHGGAWFSGSREEFRAYALHFANMGYICVCVSYRLAQESPFPGALDDINAAIDWFRTQTEKHNLDPSRIAIAGASAGGHLAMLAAYQRSNDQSTPHRIKAVINLYGPSDLTADVAKDHPAVVQFLGRPYEIAKASYREASPINHLDATDPPTLVLHGTLDEIVPISQSDILVKKLEELGIPHRYDRLPGWAHVMDLAPSVYQRSLWLMNDFLKIHLAPNRLTQN